MRLCASVGAAVLAVFAAGLLEGCSGGSSSQGGGSNSYNTTTALTVSPNPALQGATVTLTATVTASGGSTPTGTVTFTDAGVTIGMGTVTSGVATYATSTLGVGSHSLAATYSGAAGFSGSSSSAVSLVVSAPQNTTTTLTVTPNPVVAGNTVTLSATTSASSGTPAGTVTFYDGSTSLGMATLSGGIATTTTSTPAVGTHSLTASYGGGTGFNSSTSTAVSLSVQTSIPITVHGTFSFTTPNQTIAGFGGAEAFDLNYLDAHPNQAQMYTALFDPTQGLGLSFLRVQNNYYNYASAGASFDTDTPAVVKAANTAHGSPLNILMSAWTPPASLKSNNSTIGGTLKQVNGAYDYADYATFWYNSVLAYQALGVTPNYVSIQNEPDFTATYVSCRFNPTEATFQGQNYAGYDKAFAAVYSALQALPTPPKMIGPESFSAVNLLSFASALTTETPQNTELYGLAHHLYNVNSADPNPDDGLTAMTNLAAQYPTQLKFETEYYDAPGFLTAWQMHNALAVGNDNAYFYWQLAWPSSSYVNNQGADQEGLLYVENPYTPGSWQTKNGWTYNDSYYAFKHFSYFVKPGYVRYNASVDNTNERISVYQSSGATTTVIVVMNTSTTATDGLQLNLSGVSYSSSSMYRSTFSTPITTGERWSNLGAATPAAGISLPPQSVVTIVLNK